MHTCTYIIYIYTHTIHIHILVHIYACKYIYLYIYTYTYVYRYIYTFAYIHIYIYIIFSNQPTCQFEITRSSLNGFHMLQSMGWLRRAAAGGITLPCAHSKSDASFPGGRRGFICRWIRVSTNHTIFVIRDQLHFGEIRECQVSTNSLPVWDLFRLVAERWSSAGAQGQWR